MNEDNKNIEPSNISLALEYYNQRIQRNLNNELGRPSDIRATQPLHLVRLNNGRIKKIRMANFHLRTIYAKEGEEACYTKEKKQS